MARSFRSFALVSAIVTFVLLGAGAMPASAQTEPTTVISSGTLSLATSASAQTGTVTFSGIRRHRPLTTRQLSRGQF